MTTNNTNETPLTVADRFRVDTLEELLTTAQFVVEATSFEQRTLWERWSDRVHWEEHSRGWLETIGEVNGRPVNLVIHPARLNGCVVLFYEAVSQVVDWKQIEDWFKSHCWPKWDKDIRRAHCDAANFHHCLEVVGVSQ